MKLPVTLVSILLNLPPIQMFRFTHSWNSWHSCRFTWNSQKNHNVMSIVHGLYWSPISSSSSPSSSSLSSLCRTDARPSQSILAQHHHLHHTYRYYQNWRADARRPWDLKALVSHSEPAPTFSVYSGISISVKTNIIIMASVNVIRNNKVVLCPIFI